MRNIVVLTSVLLAAAAQAASTKIHVDQIGFRTDGPKVAIVAGPAALPANPGIQIVDETDKVVWKLADKPTSYTLFNNGLKDNESGDFVAFLDFSDLKTPGRYSIKMSGESTATSYHFNIGNDIYKQPAIAAYRMFYYNRADLGKPEKYAGLWSHGLDHCGTNQAKEAKVYKWKGGAWPDPVGTEVIDPTPRDVRGGWWDAGDFNKYMGNTVACHNDLMLAFELLKDVAKDNVLNIPESGNGMPDILDEARYGTEFLIRMNDGTGAAFGKCHEGGASPPESCATAVQLTEVNSGATMNRLSALAFASYVYNDVKLDPPFARKCMNEARKAWALLKAKPHPWPADPKKPKEVQYSGYWFLMDYTETRTLAAACFFAADGDPEMDKIVHEGFAQNHDWWPAMWVYTHAKGADPMLVARMKQHILDAANEPLNNTGSKRSYRAGVRGYWWGSNRSVGQTAMKAQMAAEYSDDPAFKKKCYEAAEEYAHYLLGRNPLSRCFMTNMKYAGAEGSTVIMFHSWLGFVPTPYSAKYIGLGEGKIGPAPGYIVGGVNGGMKRYVDDLDWRKNPWEFNEPDITYQSACAPFLYYLAFKQPK